MSLLRGAMKTAIGVCTALAFAGAAEANYSDVWWDPARPGRAIAIEDQGAARFAIIFDYLDDGRPIWFVAPDLRWDWDGDYGTVYATLADYEFWIVPVGRMYLDLTVQPAFMLYTAHGVEVQSRAERYAFGKQPTCDALARSSLERASFHGLWWSAADPGWAIYISEQTVQGVNTIFALLAIYSSNGGSTWVVAANTPQGEDGRFVGKLHRPRMAPRASPQAAPYVDEVGTLELVFSTTTAGELRYTLDGVATSKPIQRYLFASDPAICSLPE